MDNFNGVTDDLLNDKEITGEIQQVPSVPQFADSQLTGDDIFRMKKLSLSKSLQASEMQSAISVADSTSNFAEHAYDNESNESVDSAGVEMNQDNVQYNGDYEIPSQAPEMQLTEADMFKMKEISAAKSMLSSEMQSVASVVDTASNFDQHLPEIGDKSTEFDDDVAFDDENEIDEKNSVKYIQLSECGRFAFNRFRIDPPVLPEEVVTVLQFPDIDVTMPANVDPIEYKRNLLQSKVYLVGTAHFSKKSQDDVRQVIKQTQPDIVLVELCGSRIAILQMDKDALLEQAKRLEHERILPIIRQHGLAQAFLHVLLYQASIHITRQLGMAPGGEFRAAYDGSLEIPRCRMILGDRPINITFQRALASLSFFQRIRLVYHMLLSSWGDITPEDVERCKQKDLLEELLREMAGEFPQLSKIFVFERDIYMLHVLRSMLQQTTEEKMIAAKNVGAAFQPVNVVAVVGIGHAPGISEYWSKQELPSMGELLTIPPQTLTSKIIGIACRTVFYGTLAYGIYRVGKFTIGKFRSIV